MKHRRYAGIGARETPTSVLPVMEEIADQLNRREYILRSGHARGADRAFEKFAGSLKEIFTSHDATRASTRIAKAHHPAWHKCDSYARTLHSRNALVILGKELVTPVDFVVCWTKGGRIKGGTGVAIAIANTWDIPVFNLALPHAYDELMEFIR